MKVKDLIEKLSKISDKEAELFIYNCYLTDDGHVSYCPVALTCRTDFRNEKKNIGGFLKEVVCCNEDVIFTDSEFPKLKEADREIFKTRRYL